MADATLRFDTKIDTGNLESGLKSISGLMTSAFKISAAAITAVSSAIATAAGIGIKYNMDMENSLTTFTTLLGNQEKALAKVEELKQKAAATPFEMPQLAKATELMLSFGIGTDKVGGYLDALGDISLGNSEKLQGLTLAFAQVQSTGKLMGQDLLQMINQGFNPLQEMSKMTGKAMAVLQEEMSNGAISAAMVAEAFKHATAEGGMFYKGMENASKPATGQIATLKDNVMSLLGEISEGMTKQFTFDLIPMVNEAVEDMTMAFREKGIVGLSEAFGDVFSEILSKASSYAPQTVEISVQFIQSMAKGLYDNRHEIIQAASDTGAAILSAIFGEDIKLHWDKFVGDITASFKTFADTVEIILKPVGAVVEGTFKFLLDNGSLIVSTITGIGTAMVGMSIAPVLNDGLKAFNATKTVIVEYAAAVSAANLTATTGAMVTTLLTSSLKTSEIIYGALTLKIPIYTATQTLATRAVEAFKLAWATNPFGVVAVAIGAVVGVAVLLNNEFNKATSETKALNAEIDNLSEAYKEINEEMSKSKERFTDSINSLENEAIAAQILAEEIKMLSSEEDKSIEKKGLLISKINELNSIYPDLNLYYDEETKALSMTNLELDANIELRRKQVMLAATEKAQLETATQLANAMKNKALAETTHTEALEKAKKEGIEGKELEIAFAAAISGTTSKRIEAANAVISSGEAVKKYDNQIALLKDEMTVYDELLQENTVNINRNTDSTAKQTEENEKQIQQNKKQNQSISDLVSSLDKAEKAYIDTIQAQDISASSMASLADEYFNLIDNNTELLAQYPQLYAALDANNSVQENSRAIAEAVWKIRRQLLINELQVQKETIEKNIEGLETQRDAAILTYSQMGEAAALAWATGLSVQKVATNQANQEFGEMISDAKNQAASIGELIKELNSQEMPKIKPSSGSSSSGSRGSSSNTTTAIKEQNKLLDEAYKKLEQRKKLGEVTTKQELDNIIDISKAHAKSDEEKLAAKQKIYDTVNKYVDEEIKGILEARDAGKISSDEALAQILALDTEYNNLADTFELVKTKKDELANAPIEIQKATANDALEALRHRQKMGEDVSKGMIAWYAKVLASGIYTEKELMKFSEERYALEREMLDSAIHDAESILNTEKITIQSRLQNINDYYNAELQKAGLTVDEIKRLENEKLIATQFIYDDDLANKKKNWQYDVDMGVITKDEYIQRLKERLDAKIDSAETEKGLLKEVYDYEQSLMKEEVSSISGYDIGETDLAVAEAKLAMYKSLLDKYPQYEEEINTVITETHKTRNSLLLDGQKQFYDALIESERQYVAAMEASEGLIDESGKKIVFTTEDKAKSLQKIVEINKKAVAELLKNESNLNSEQRKLLQDRQSALRQSEKDYTDYYTQIQKSAQQAQEELIKIANETNKKLTEAQSDYSKKSLDIESKRAEAIAEIQRKEVESRESINQKFIEDEKRLTEAYDNELESRTKSIANFAGIFGKITREEVSGQELLQNLKDQLETMSEWRNNISKLQEAGFSDALIKELESMGPASADEIKALTQLTASELDEYNKLYEDKFALAGEIAENQMADQRQQLESDLIMLRQVANDQISALANDTALAMQEINDKAAEDLKSLSSDFAKTYAEISGSAKTEMGKLKKTIDETFVSKDMTSKVYDYGVEIGKSYTDGIMDGIGSDNDDSLETFPDSGSVVSEKDLQESGKAIPENIGKGILGSAALLTKPAESIINTMIQDMKSNFVKFDPLAKELHEAISKAVTENLDLLYEPSTAIIDTIIEAMKSNFPKINPFTKDFLTTMSKDIINNLSILTEPSRRIIDKIIQTMKENLYRIREVTDAIYLEFTGGIDSHSWERVGSNMIMGMIDGIMDNIEPLVSAVATAVHAALDAAKTELEIASPSKKTRKQGVFMGMGWIAGLEDMKPKLMQTVRGLSTKMLSMPLNAFNINSYAPQAAMASAGYYNNNVSESSSQTNIYNVDIHKMTYTEMNDFIDSLSTAIVKRGR